MILRLFLKCCKMQCVQPYTYLYLLKGQHEHSLHEATRSPKALESLSNEELESGSTESLSI